jgi:hypothetical protein
MQTYDLLKVLELTSSCLNKTKMVLSSSPYLNNGDLAYLCSYYITLHDLKLVLDDFFLKNDIIENKKVEDQEFLTKVMKYVKLTAHFEAEANKFISFYTH